MVGFGSVFTGRMAKLMVYVVHAFGSCTSIGVSFSSSVAGLLGLVSLVAIKLLSSLGAECMLVQIHHREKEKIDMIALHYTYSWIGVVLS